MRIKIDYISRRGGGRNADNTQASMVVYNVDPTATAYHLPATAQTVWNAATGGSSQNTGTTPITPRSDGSGLYDWWVSDPGLYWLQETVDGQTMPAVAWYAIQGRMDDWTALSMLNSWVADATSVPGYTKTSDGLVLLRGRVTRAATSTLAIANLPAGYRPTQTVTGLHYAAASAGGAMAPGLLDVAATGDITPQVAKAEVWLDSYVLRAG